MRRLRSISLTSALQILTLLCAALLALMGGIVLLGWLTGNASLSALGEGYVPMAPSTAALFVASAIAILLYTRSDPSRAARNAGITLALAGGLIATVLFVLSSQGIYLDAEHAGIVIVDVPGGIPIGHISPITAGCFIVGFAAYLFLLLSPQGSRRANFAWGLACLLTGVGLAFTVAYLFGMPLLYDTSFVPPALSTSISLAALGVALFGLSTPRMWRMKHRASVWAGSGYVSVFILVAISIVVAAYAYYRNSEEDLRLQLERHISAVAELKVTGINEWYRERIEMDANLTYKNRVFSDLVARYIANPQDAAARGNIAGWLEGYEKFDQYDRARLLDAQGEVLISVPDGLPPIDAAILDALPRVSQTGKPEIVDFYRSDQDRRVYLAVLIPILEEQNPDKTIGYVSVRIDPEVYLYPYINRWPGESTTAETLLVRREGDHVLFLNRLRFNIDAALNLRFPMSKVELPAVKAALGETGVVGGLDYRDKIVIADTRAISNSPWFLVSKIDIEEAYAPLRERLSQTVAIVILLLLVFGSTVTAVWRQQRLNFYRAQADVAESLRQSEYLWRTLAENYPHSYLSVIEKDLTVSYSAGLEFKKRNVDPAQYNGMTIEQIFGDQADIVREHYLHTLAGQGQTFELSNYNQHQLYRTAPLPAKDGSIPRMLSIVEDITERKQAEKEILHLNIELEQRVAERTVQLEAANKELEAFAYSVSHDLRAPLRAMEGFSSALLSRYHDQLDDQGRHYLDRIQQASQRMGQLINDMLNLSRITRSEFTPQSLDLSALVRTITDELKTHDTQRQAEFRISEPLIVQGDSHLLRIALQNLLENAWKFSSTRPKAVIEVGQMTVAEFQLQNLDSTLPMDLSNSSAIYFIRDNGVGFDMTYTAKLFAPFQRLHAMHEFPGTGIGLAIVQRIITRHGGRVWPQAQLDKGATFYFTLGGM